MFLKEYLIPKLTFFFFADKPVLTDLGFLP